MSERNYNMSLTEEINTFIEIEGKGNARDAVNVALAKLEAWAIVGADNVRRIQALEKSLSTLVMLAVNSGIPLVMTYGDNGHCRECKQPLEGQSCPYCGWDSDGVPNFELRESETCRQARK